MTLQTDAQNNISLIAANIEKACIGCSSCRHSCPSGAISMAYDEEGFKVPVIDQALCINCGKCRAVCPVCHPVYDKAQKPRCFAAQASDELRTGRSASGAMFPILAQKILDDGGVVCGAAWNSEWKCEHIIVDTAEGLERIKNSKYVQSDLENCLPELKKLLEADCPVLFTGTPCQVAALNAFLGGKDYENLYTVDIICHGVPSPMVWKRYLEENFDVSSIRHIAFRDKRKGWAGETFVVEYNDGNQFWGGGSSDSYFNAFLRNLTLRKSCGQCLFNRLPRQGDLSIGDFWGIQKIDAHYNDGNGTSVVLENTIKGCLFFDSIKDQLKKINEFDISLCTHYNPNIISSSVENNQRDVFFAKIKEKSVRSVLEYFAKDKSDCKIINYWFAVNYGAILTCYALQECLKELGYTVKVINYMTDEWRKKYIGSFSEMFAKKYLNLTKEVWKKEDLSKLNDNTDTFITGSDQVFRYDIYSTHGGNAYQLDFVESDKRSIACSASFGLDIYKAPLLEEQVFWHLLEQLDALSVRESAGAEICSQKRLDAKVIVDPVFYLSRDRWLKLADSCEEEVPSGGVLYFSLPYGKSQTPQILSPVAKRLEAEVTILPFDRKRSVEAWLSAIKNAKFVVTDSFHATCFALIMHKPFIVLSKYAESRSRMDEILGKVRLSTRIVSAYTVPENLDELLTPIDWKSVDSALFAERAAAMEWLKSSLKINVKHKSSSIMIEHLIDEIKYCKHEINILKKQPTSAASSAEIMGHIEWLKSESHKTEDYLAHMMTLFSHEKSIKIKYYRYKWMSKITWGKLHRKYLTKRWEQKALLNEIRQFKKMH